MNEPTDITWQVLITRQLDIYAEMRLTPSVIVRGRNGVPANATLTPPRPPSTPKDDRRE